MGVGVKFDMGAFSECPLLKEVNMLGTLALAEPDPTQPQPTETKPTASQQKDTDNDQSMAMFVSIVISVAILAAGGAVSAVLIIRKRR